MKIESRRMVAIVSLLLVVGFLVTSLASYYVSKGEIRDALISRELPMTSDNVYSEVQRDMLQPVFLSSMMAHDTFLQDWVTGGEKDVEAVSRYLAEIMEKYNASTSYFISEATRNYYHPRGIVQTVSKDDPEDVWYFRVRQMKEDYEINIDYDQASRNSITIFINYRVRDRNGKYIGITGVGQSIYHIRKHIDRYRDRYQRNVFFATKSGDVALVDTGGNDDFRNIKVDACYGMIAEKLLAVDQGSFECARNGDTILVNSRYIPELKWYLIVEQAQDTTLKVLRKTLYGNLAVCFAVTAIVLMVTGYTINKYQRRIEDMTERELSEKKSSMDLLTAERDRAENATRLKDKFVSLVSHDMKGPLGAIGGFMELIAEGNCSRDEIHNYSKRSYEAVTDLQIMIDRLLDLSSLQSGHIVPAKVPVEVSLLAKAAIYKLDEAASSKGITIRNETTPGARIALDSTLAGVVLFNLLTNALKFTMPGGQVTLFSPAAGIIAVKDTGKGIQKNILGDIFKFEVRTTTLGTQGERGTGLGLPYCHEIMKAHGGSLRFETGDSGTTFYMEFPVT